MTTIYLIRHAEAEGNLYRFAQGQNESALTDRGWRQVRALEERFRDIPVDGVYTSDLYRARATAAAVSGPKGLEPREVPALREICVGEWEGRTWGDIARRESERMEEFSHQIDQWRIPGAEAPGDVLERVRTAVMEIAARNDGKAIAIVSHGYAIRLFLAWVQGMSLAETGATPHGDNTAVSLLEYDPRTRTLRLIYRDDNRHLRTPEFLAGEKPIRRQNALEPGLWFAPLEPDDPLFAEMAGEAVREAFGIPFDRERLVSEAAGRSALAGYLQEKPVGLLQMGPENGWISIAYIREAYRKRGFGMQLIGQAVQKTRRGGGEYLWAASPEGIFFPDNGFVREGRVPGGRTVWRKGIGFPPM